METIKNYLDNMFSSLPDTTEVRKAKEELYQMMEDKYTELKEEGKSENEAIGIVIAEFGNLEEIKEELEIEAKTEYKKNEPNTTQKNIQLTLKEATEYLNIRKKYSTCIAIGVMLCVFSPALLIFMSGLSEIYGLKENIAASLGLTALFLLIIIAVALFIYSGTQLEDFEYLKKESFQLEASTETYIREEKKRQRSVFSVKIIIGVILCIFSVIPLIISGCFENEFACITSVSILLILVGIGVYFLVSAGVVEESYSILLQEKDYRKEKKDSNLQTIASVYWCIITILYLGWSFLTFNWHITWIIWPIAGVLYGAIETIYSNLIKK